jgi:hypothetical protein
MTVAPSQPTLRRLPAPACEPPYDDELPGRSGAGRWSGPAAEASDAVQGTLALAFVLPSGVPAVPVAPVGLRLVAPLDSRSGAQDRMDDAEFGPQPTDRVDLPEPRGWAARLVQAIVEVLAGDRPLGQLVRWTSTEVYDEVSGLTLPGGTGGRGSTGSTAGPGAGRSARAVVRSVHVSEPVDGVAEVAALVRRGARTTAVALRLEGLDGRWQCTALELG